MPELCRCGGVRDRNTGSGKHPHKGPEGGRRSGKETEGSGDRQVVSKRGKPQSATSVAAKERRKLWGLCNQGEKRDSKGLSIWGMGMRQILVAKV